jgi:hypothetical protein
MRVLCVYIVPSPDIYKPLVKRFVESYNAHPAGYPRDLLILRKGLDPFPRDIPIAGIELNAPDTGYDLGTFFWMLESGFQQNYDIIMLLSTTATFKCDDWLAKYVAIFRDHPEIQAVSATASVEKGISDRDFNPHLRTANIAFRAGVLDELELPYPVTKHDCWELEHGKHNITRQIMERNGRCVVVGCHGNVWDCDTSDAQNGWYRSHTFRTGAQENLIIGDSQTDWYDDAHQDMRDLSTKSTWWVLGI